MPAVTRVLKLIPQLKVEAVESSAAAYGGSFGYEGRALRGLDEDGPS